MKPKSKSQRISKQPLPKEALELIAARFRVLGDATRLNLVQLLMPGEKSVAELCQLTEMSQANISKHLGILAEHGIVSRRKQALFVFYAVSDKSIYELCDLVCGALANRAQTVQQYLK